MKNSAKISVITPVRNMAYCVENCILSVAKQKYPNKEHLFIDGGSNDGTLAIIKKYAKNHRHIKYISENDAGIYHAMNKGIGLADGEWLYFLGADDVLFNQNVFEKISKNFKHADIIYGNVIWGKEGKIYDGKFSILKLMKKNLCQQSIFFKREIFQTLGNFETDYKVLSDWAFNLKWIEDKRINNKYLKLVIAKYNTKGFSSKASATKFIEDFKIRVRCLIMLLFRQKVNIGWSERLEYHGKAFKFRRFCTSNFKLSFLFTKKSARFAEIPGVTSSVKNSSRRNRAY